MTLRPIVRWMPVRAVVASALALALCCVAPGLSDGAAPAPTQPPPPKVPVHPVGPPHVGSPRPGSPLNPHLHPKAVTVTPTTPGHPNTTAPHHPRPTSVFHGHNARGHSGVARRGYVHAHGLGQIAGQVRAADGAPARGAWVRLARYRGGRLRRAAARHGTYTDSAGRFVMRAVKSGRFRAVASRKDLGRGFVQSALNPGGLAHVTIQINRTGRRPA